MASVFQRVPHPLVGPDRHPHVDPTPSEHWYDRSSLDVAAVVTIEDQTEEDFFRYAPENRFCEFIDGVVYMPSPVSIRHQELVFFLLSLLAGYRDERGGGTVMMGPAVLRVVPGRDLEPDIFVTPPGAGRYHPAAWPSVRRTLSSRSSRRATDHTTSIASEPSTRRPASRRSGLSTTATRC